jgi:16S rRNA (guanine1207-N2)-methyltransferase
MERELAGRDRANRLLDRYGRLLTARQREFLVRYYQDDLSLGEIAAQLRISRQAVHDGLRRALSALERFEAALGLVGDGPRAGGDHYFTRRPRSAPQTRTVHATLRGRHWTFAVARGVFARRGVDPGTRLLIEAMRIEPTDRVLDLGCGYGAVGLVAAALAPAGGAWLVDANQRAAALARENAAAHRLRNVAVLVGDRAAAIRDASMDVVVTNPPIRAGRRVVAGFIDDAHRVLRPGGRFYLVARTAQGARTLARLIAARFGGVRQVALRSGYRVYEATRGEGPAAGAAEGPAGV